MTTQQAQSYAGSAANPLPPAPAGWAMCHRDDAVGLEICGRVEKGKELGVWQFKDEMTDHGLYRPFRWQTAAGQTATSALRYVGIAEAERLSREEAGEADTMGATAPPPGGGTGGSGGGGGGLTTPQVAPPVTASITSWTADTSNATAVGIANTIAFQNTPVAWTDQHVYYQTIDGTPFAFTQNYENGAKFVIVWRGQTASSPNQPNGTPPPANVGGSSSGGMSTGAVVGIALVGVAVVGGIVWAVVH